MQGTLLSMALALTTLLANAATKPPECSRPILVAASPLGPAMMIAADGTITGGARNTLDLIAKDTGCQFDYIVVPRVRAYRMLETGEVDMLTNAIRSPERDQFAYFVQMGTVSAALISRSKISPAVKSVAELVDSSLNIIRVRADDLGDEYRALLAHPRMRGRIVDALAPENAVMMLLAGRADAMLMVPTTIVDTWERLGKGSEPVLTRLDGLPALPFGHYYSKARMSAADIAVLEKAVHISVNRGDTQRYVEMAYPAWAVEFVKSSEQKPAKPAKP